MDCESQLCLDRGPHELWTPPTGSSCCISFSLVGPAGEEAEWGLAGGSIMPSTRMWSISLCCYGDLQVTFSITQVIPVRFTIFVGLHRGTVWGMGRGFRGKIEEAKQKAISELWHMWHLCHGLWFKWFYLVIFMAPISDFENLCHISAHHPIAYQNV